MKVHYLHIGKTGGTAIGEAIVNAPSQVPGLVLGGHDLTLADVPAGQGIVVFLREPASRFVSAFYSRYREARPRDHRPWLPEERVAFERFTTANALAEALSSEDPEAREAARAAMRAIRHVCTSYRDWLGSDAELDVRMDDIVLIGFQETLSRDFAVLKTLGAAPADAVLPDDDIGTHRTPAGFDTTLSDRGRANILDWYADDVALYARCADIRLERWGLDTPGMTARRRAS